MNHLKDAIHHLKDRKHDQKPLLGDGAPQQQQQQQPQASGRLPDESEPPGSDSTPAQRPNQGPEPTHHNPDLQATTQHAIDVFFASARPNGDIAGIGYWQTANAYSAIALHATWSHSTHNLPLLTRQIRAAAHDPAHRDYINEFNDDSLWWANTLLDLHAATPCEDQPLLIAAAARIWNHVATRSVIPAHTHRVHGNDMAGGVLWTTRANEDQLNAITTGLFAEVGARLALLEPEPRQRRLYVDAAARSLDWVLRCRYRADEALVLDTIKLRTGECVDWAFTYTTGQGIAAAVALYRALRQQRDPETAQRYMDCACEMATHALTRPSWVSADGVLTEAGNYSKENHEPWRNDDVVGFKSVLLRSLAKLYQLLRQEGLAVRLQERIAAFLQRQFDSVSERCTNGKGQYGPWWGGPMDMPTSHSQMAVLDVMAAVHLVSC